MEKGIHIHYEGRDYFYSYNEYKADFVPAGGVFVQSKDASKGERELFISHELHVRWDPVEDS